MPKPWWDSKTLAANLFALLVAGYTAALAPDLVASEPRVAAIAAALMALVNLALRWVTGQPIAGSPAEVALRKSLREMVEEFVREFNAPTGPQGPPEAPPSAINTGLERLPQ